ncbi:microfibril-associated glycoprotein 4-like [Amphiura filiformis]|uniref:microfibril-associated glycoprotein 4-like n=1 Tax=Amphiura filiformis TaxID=82378 RepID=UPI003B21950C
MLLHYSKYTFAVIMLTYLTYIQKCNAVSLLERLNTGSPATAQESNYAAEITPTDFSPLEVHTCSVNTTLQDNSQILTEIRKVGETCRQSCKKQSGGNPISSELGHFTRRLQLLQLTVEGLAIMVFDAMERLEEPHAPEFLKSPYPKDCNEVQNAGEDLSGVYTIHPEGCGPPFQVYCDMDTEGGGWTLFQRRHDGSEDFDRGWGSYRRGFGDLHSEFWLGNDKLHRLSFQDEYELRIEMELFNGTKAFAIYSSFWVGDVHANYRLHIGTYNGTAGDSLEYHDDLPFTTIDKDNDLSYTNCAEVYSGAWWYNKCHYSNLNGRYLGETTDEFAKGVVWFEFSGFYDSLKRSEMKIRAKL